MVDSREGPGPIRRALIFPNLDDWGEGWSVNPDVFAGPFFAAAGLLVVGGASKLLHPAPAARALHAARIPGGWAAARALGFVEVSVGGAALLAPRPAVAAAVAVLYIAFALFVAAVATGRVPSPSCGCLGEREVPASRLHVLLDLAVAAVALLVFVRPPLGLGALLPSLPFFGVPAIIGIVLIGSLGYLVVSYLPQLFFSYRGTDMTADHLTPGER